MCIMCTVVLTQCKITTQHTHTHTRAHPTIARRLLVNNIYQELAIYHHKWDESISTSSVVVVVPFVLLFFIGLFCCDAPENGRCCCRCNKYQCVPLSVILGNYFCVYILKYLYFVSCFIRICQKIVIFKSNHFYAF